MEVTNKSLIMLDLEAETKLDVIKLISKRIFEEGIVENYDEYLKSLLDRESISATAIGFGVGLPHGKSQTVKKPAVAFARLKKPIIWSSEEDDEQEEAKIVFMLAIPEADKSTTHLNILVELSKKIIDDDFRTSLENSNTVDEIVDIINK